MSFDKALTDSQKGGIIATKTRLQWCNSRNNDRMPSHNSSTVFCSLIRKSPQNGQVGRAFSQSADRQKLKTANKKTRRQKSKKLLKQFLKLKTDEFPQEHFTMHFMKKCTFVYFFKKASHLRKKTGKFDSSGQWKGELDCCRLEESHMVGWTYFLSVAMALKNAILSFQMLTNLRRQQKESVMRFRKKYIVIWYYLCPTVLKLWLLQMEEILTIDVHFPTPSIYQFLSLPKQNSGLFQSYYS